MNIIRWNVMGLVLLALVWNSGLALADSISSVSPPSVQPGQVCMDNSPQQISAAGYTGL